MVRKRYCPRLHPKEKEFSQRCSARLHVECGGCRDVFAYLGQPRFLTKCGREPRQTSYGNPTRAKRWRLQPPELLCSKALADAFYSASLRQQESLPAHLHLV